MSSRFYLPSSGAAAVSPTDLTGWDETDGQSSLQTDVVKTNTAMTTGSLLSWTTYGNKQLARQFVSKPLSAQTISGTIKGQICCGSNNALNSKRTVFRVIVVSNDGATTRGTLLGINIYSLTNFLVLPVNKYLAPSGTAISSLTIQDGDRLVFQVGFTNTVNSNVTKLNGNNEYGDNQTTDLPEDETDSNYTTKNPWIELSMDITFQGMTNPKTINGLLKSNIKTVNGLAIASMKSFNGLT